MQDAIRTYLAELITKRPIKKLECAEPGCKHKDCVKGNDGKHYKTSQLKIAEGTDDEWGLVIQAQAAESLNTIKNCLVFLVSLVAVGLIAGVILALQ